MRTRRRRKLTHAVDDKLVSESRVVAAGARSSERGSTRPRTKSMMCAPRRGESACRVPECREAVVPFEQAVHAVWVGVEETKNRANDLLNFFARSELVAYALDCVRASYDGLGCSALPRGV